MKVLYGVVGEGMGHAMRSRVVIEHLLKAGHEVEVVASNRAVNYLRRFFAEVHNIHGFHIVTDDNRVRKGSTLWQNLRDGVAAIPDQIASYFRLLEDFRPEVVISDFESWTYLFARAHGLPVFSIDNMQIIHRCLHLPEIYEDVRAEFEVTKAFVSGKLPLCNEYIITTFFYPELRKEHTTLVPPILRPEILGASRVKGEHLLVYQTAEGYDALAESLARTGLECRIYGMRRGIETEQVEGNLRYRPFSEAGFIDDLAGARGVIAGGGFTLMGESVYLHKPLLSVPIEGQFEQIINGRYLEKLGYGLTVPEISDAAVQRFVADLSGFEGALAAYSQDGNSQLYAAVDGALDRVAAGL